MTSEGAVEIGKRNRPVRVGEPVRHRLQPCLLEPGDDGDARQAQRYELAVDAAEREDVGVASAVGAENGRGAGIGLCPDALDVVEMQATAFQKSRDAWSIDAPSGSLTTPVLRSIKMEPTYRAVG